VHDAPKLQSADSADAFRSNMEGHTRGKIVIAVDQDS